MYLNCIYLPRSTVNFFRRILSVVSFDHPLKLSYVCFVSTILFTFTSSSLIPKDSGRWCPLSSLPILIFAVQSILISNDAVAIRFTLASCCFLASCNCCVFRTDLHKKNPRRPTHRSNIFISVFILQHKNHPNAESIIGSGINEILRLALYNEMNVAC